MEAIEQLLPRLVDAPGWAATTALLAAAVVALWRQRDRSRQSEWERMRDLLEELRRQRDAATDRADRAEDEAARAKHDNRELLKLIDQRREE